MSTSNQLAAAAAAAAAAAPDVKKNTINPISYFLRSTLTSEFLSFEADFLPLQ